MSIINKFLFFVVICLASALLEVVSASSSASLLNKYKPPPSAKTYTLYQNTKTKELKFYEHPFLPTSTSTATSSGNMKPVCEISHTIGRNITGWNYLTLSPEATLLKEDPNSAYYFAGYSEGYWTAEDISNMHFNANPQIDNNTQKWLDEHVDFLKNDLLSNETLVREYPALALGGFRFYKFVEGMTDGFNNGNKNHQEKWNITKMLTMSALGGLPGITIAAKYMYQQDHKEEESSSKLFKRSFDEIEQDILQNNNDMNPFRNLHCSAMIKLLDGDILHTHSTWIDNPYMTKLFKTYHFETTVAMSSFAGSLSSMGDFYVTPSFSVTETSIMSLNTTLQKLYIRPRGGLLECFRVMIANIWAKDSMDWAQIFLTQAKQKQESSSSSSTNQQQQFFFQVMDYSNQYFVIDQRVPTFNIETKKFNPIAPNSGLFVIVEQLGPFSQYADWTERLVKDTYIGGFNFAFFPKIQELTGLTHLENKYGSMFSTTEYARAAIFARNHSQVKSISDMMSLMRWNRGYDYNAMTNGTVESDLGSDYVLDPLSKIPNCDGCWPEYSPSLAIASRADLCAVPDKNLNNFTLGNLTGTMPGNFLGAHIGGEIDNKIVAWSDHQRATTASSSSSSSYSPLVVNIILGPTQSGGALPAFNWSTVNPQLSSSTNAVRHRGLPESFDFTYQIPPNVFLKNSKTSSNHPNGNNASPSTTTTSEIIEVAIGSGACGALIAAFTVVLVMGYRNKKRSDDSNQDSGTVEYERASTNNTSNDNVNRSQRYYGSV